MKRSVGLRTAAFALGTVLAIVGIGACTASGGSSGDSGGGGKAANVPAPRAAASAAAGSAARFATKAGHDAASVAGDITLSSAKIRNASMTVAVKHGQSVATKADTADAIALRTGGEVDADERTSGKDATATLILRVPPDDLTGVLDELSKLGVEQSRHLSTEDVTSKVADVASRVDSARVAIARLRDLYQHATKVADVITIESELSGRESDLESLQAQQRALGAQTATATVTLSLYNSKAALIVKPPAKHHHRSGFLGGLQNGWNAFSHGAAWLATALGAVLPFALLFIILGLAGRLLWPRLRPVRQPAPAGPPSE